MPRAPYGLAPAENAAAGDVALNSAPNCARARSGGVLPHGYILPSVPRAAYVGNYPDAAVFMPYYDVYGYHACMHGRSCRWHRVRRIHSVQYSAKLNQRQLVGKLRKAMIYLNHWLETGRITVLQARSSVG